MQELPSDSKTANRKVNLRFSQPRKHLISIGERALVAFRHLRLCLSDLPKYRGERVSESRDPGRTLHWQDVSSPQRGTQEPRICQRAGRSSRDKFFLCIYNSDSTKLRDQLELQITAKCRRPWPARLRNRSVSQ